MTKACMKEGNLDTLTAKRAQEDEKLWKYKGTLGNRGQLIEPYGTDRGVNNDGDTDTASYDRDNPKGEGTTTDTASDDEEPPELDPRPTTDSSDEEASPTVDSSDEEASEDDACDDTARLKVPYDDTARLKAILKDDYPRFAAIRATYGWNGYRDPGNDSGDNVAPPNTDEDDKGDESPPLGTIEDDDDSNEPPPLDTGSDDDSEDEPPPLDTGESSSESSNEDDDKALEMVPADDKILEMVPERDKPTKAGVAFARLLWSFNFHPAPHDKHIWMRATSKYYEYVTVYTDDMCFAYEDKSEIPFERQLRWRCIATISEGIDGYPMVHFLSSGGSISAGFAAYWAGESIPEIVLGLHLRTRPSHSCVLLTNNQFTGIDLNLVVILIKWAL